MIEYNFNDRQSKNVYTEIETINNIIITTWRFTNYITYYTSLHKWISLKYPSIFRTSIIILTNTEIEINSTKYKSYQVDSIVKPNQKV